MALPSRQEIRRQVQLALDEDIGSGDLTASLIPADQLARGYVIAREPAVIAGLDWFRTVFEIIDRRISLTLLCADGDRVAAGQRLLSLQGPARSLLTGERTALNFLQTLSAVATRTATYVDAVAGTGVNILDTRKTIPGLRLAEKYAVTCGGGVNHRIGLYDAILIKENHISAAGSIAAAMSAAEKVAGDAAWIEVEVESLEEMQQALDNGAKRLLLDNFSLEQLREAVELNAGRARLEASGNVSLQTVRDIAETGVDDISSGELTKHIQAIDLSMLFES